MSGTHTYSILHVTPSCYDEVQARLTRAGWTPGGPGGQAIDMHGLALQADPASPSTEDTAAAILAGLIETARVMKENAFAAGLTDAFRDYDTALGLLTLAAEHLRPVEADAYTNPVDKIADRATRET